jgi:hypothetical protein
MTTPDLFEPLLVYRYTLMNSMGRIASLSYSHNWQPGWNTASCGRAFPEDYCFPQSVIGALYGLSPGQVMLPNIDEVLHGKPAAPLCSCGFYAFYFPAQFGNHPSMLASGAEVTRDRTWPGALWSGWGLMACLVKGRTQLYNNGLRAQYIKPLALSTFNPVTRTACRTALSPGIEVLDSPIALLKAYPPQDHSELVGCNVKPWPFVGIPDSVAARFRFHGPY